MGLLGSQSSKDISQARQGLVDAAGLLLMLALHLTPRQPLTALTDSSFPYLMFVLQSKDALQSD